MIRLFLSLALLYGAWQGVGEIRLALASPDEPSEVALVALEQGGAAPSAWLRVTGGTAHPSVLEYTEDNRLVWRFVAFYTPDVYWSSFDENGAFTGVDGAFPEASVVARVAPDVDVNEITMAMVYDFQGTVLSGGLGLDGEQVGIFRGEGVAFADDAIMVYMDEAPNPLGRSVAITSILVLLGLGLGASLFLGGKNA